MRAAPMAMGLTMVATLARAQAAPQAAPTHRSAIAPTGGWHVGIPQKASAALGLARALAGQGQTSSARILLDDWLRKEPADAEASALRDALPPR